MNNTNLLPLGSVVKLTTTPTSILIIGYLHQDKETKKRYSYCGINYPFGVTLSQDTVLFNPDAIQKIEFEQAESPEASEFRKAIETVLAAEQS